MSFQRKLRKLVLHPVAFFRDSKLFNSKNLPPKDIATNTNDIFSRELEKNFLQIVKFPDSYPVNSLCWKDGQILWPAFRLYLTLLATQYVRKQLKNARVFQRFPAVLWRKYNLENGFAEHIDDYNPQEQYDFVVFCALRSISWVKEGDKIHDRLLDPLIEKLQQYGKTKKILTVTASGELPDNLAISPDFILFPLKYTVCNSYDINNYDTFVAKFISTFKQYNVTRADLNYFVDVFIYLYSNYVKLLKKIKPKAVFFFPIDISAPLIMAAHSLGIQAIDIQHGNMSGFYLQYNRWDEKYREGYSLWPDTVLTWSAREKKHIAKTFNKHIKGVVFGYQWLERYKTTEPLKNRSLQIFCSKFKHIVIVSLSDHTCLPELMETIVRDTRAEEFSIGFIFKRKPKNKKATIPQLYNIYADDAITTSSFLSIAKYADLHVTESSSCIYEADYIGLNTILTGNSWEFHFKDLVEAGRVYTAQSADDFYAIFEEAISFCHYPRLIDNYSNEFDQFMKTLIQKKN